MPKRENFCVTASYAFTSNSSVHVSNYANDGKVNGPVYDSDRMLKPVGGICGTVDKPSEPAKLSVGPCYIPSWCGLLLPCYIPSWCCLHSPCYYLWCK